VHESGVASHDAIPPFDQCGRMVEGDGGEAATMGRISTETVYFWAAIASVAFDGVAHATEARYACSDGTQLVARFSPPSITNGRVALTFETGRKIVLPQVMSADGGRYANNSIEFWIKGRNATLTRRGASETCSTR